VEEMLEWMQEVVQTEYNPETDVILSSGDYNIQYCPMVDLFKNRLLGLSKDFQRGIDLLDKEYEDVLARYLSKYFDDDHRVNHPLVARDLVRIELGPELVTFGDALVDSKTGKEYPAETFLTPALELMSKQGLDYMIHYDDANPKAYAGKIKVVPGSTKCQKALVEDLIKQKLLSSQNTRRRYTQLSDHYAISCVL
jgi:hypothetical protein